MSTYSFLNYLISRMGNEIVRNIRKLRQLIRLVPIYKPQPMSQATFAVSVLVLYLRL